MLRPSLLYVSPLMVESLPLPQMSPTPIGVVNSDILFIPPYYWHNVETLTTPSVSLSTMSDDQDTLAAMDVCFGLAPVCSEQFILG